MWVPLEGILEDWNVAAHPKRRTDSGCDRAGLGISDCAPPGDPQVWEVAPHEEVLPGRPFRQHLKYSHAGTRGKWISTLENACMTNEPFPEPGPDRELVAKLG